MSIREIDIAIHKLSENGAHIQTPGWSSFAAGRMVRVAENADIMPSHARIEVLIWSDGSFDAEEYRAVRVFSPEGDKVYNTVRGPGLPRYLGDYRIAPGFIRQMKAVERVM